MVDIASGCHDGPQNAAALFQHNSVESVADFCLTGILQSFLNALDGFFASIAVVDNTVAFTGVQELLDVICAFASHTNDGMDIAPVGELDSKRTDGSASTVYDKGNGVLCRCPREGQRQMVVKGND